MQQFKILSPENDTDLQLLKNFVASAGNSLLSFRYFSSRPLDIIKNHLLTVLLLDAEDPIAYGHLDKEDEKIWLGIAVVQNETGKGIGSSMMKFLLQHAAEKNYQTIHLSVDKTNVNAVELYKKFGFTIQKDISANVYLMNYKAPVEA